MGGSGGSTPQAANPYAVDQGKLAEFMKSQAGSAFASQYDPTNSYTQIGNQIITYNPGKSNMPATKGYAAVPGSSTSGSNNRDVTQFMSAYQSWLTGNQQTQANWQDYANTVDANKGGEGDNTITDGAAVSQRNALLGSLANAGKTTAPTPGLGSMGTIK